MHSTHKFSSLVPLLACFALGCSVQPFETEAEEDIGSVEQAFSTADCASLGANAVQTGGFEHTSPRSYNKCFKGYIVDMVDYYGDGFWNESSRVGWGDTLPTTQAACEAAWLTAIIYETTPSGNVGLDIRSANGVWKPEGGGWQAWCIGPEVRVGDLMQQGGDYRVAVTARTSQSSSAATRAVQFYSLRLL